MCGLLISSLASRWKLREGGAVWITFGVRSMLWELLASNFSVGWGMCAMLWWAWGGVDLSSVLSFVQSVGGESGTGLKRHSYGTGGFWHGSRFSLPFTEQYSWECPKPRALNRHHGLCVGVTIERSVLVSWTFFSSVFSFLVFIQMMQHNQKAVSEPWG